MAQSDPDSPQLLSLRRAARATGLSRSMLRRAIAEGELPAYRPGRRTLFVRLSDVQSWIGGHAVRQTDHARARLAEVLDEERGRHDQV
jgi:excisionase family DNA binding protein